jgi:hypothetical protein
LGDGGGKECFVRGVTWMGRVYGVCYFRELVSGRVGWGGFSTRMWNETRYIDRRGSRESSTKYPDITNRDATTCCFWLHL